MHCLLVGILAGDFGRAVNATMKSMFKAIEQVSPPPKSWAPKPRAPKQRAPKPRAPKPPKPWGGSRWRGG
jgi:hypothetical protein